VALHDPWFKQIEALGQHDQVEFAARAAAQPMPRRLFTGGKEMTVYSTDIDGVGVEAVGRRAIVRPRKRGDRKRFRWMLFGAAAVVLLVLGGRSDLELWGGPHGV